MPEPNWSSVYDNLFANLLWVVLVFVFAALILRPIKLLIRRLRPKINSEIPHVSADVSTIRRNEKWFTNVVLRNSGKEPAYNIYLYLFEKNVEDSYSIKNLGREDIKAGVLGAGEKLTFIDKEVIFDGCNVTCDQEIWVDYENASRTAFRVILHPPTPRGDDWAIEPPHKISRRLLSIPGMVYRAKDKKWKEIRDGKMAIKLNIGK